MIYKAPKSWIESGCMTNLQQKSPYKTLINEMTFCSMKIWPQHNQPTGNSTVYWLQRFSESSEFAGRKGWSSGAGCRWRLPQWVPSKNMCAFSAA